MKNPPIVPRARTMMAAALIVALAACSGGGYSTAPNPTGGGGPGGGNMGGGDGTTISVAGTSFDPSALTITVGQAVSWVFSGVTHNVQFAGAGAPTNIPDTSNGTVSRTFNTKGTFTMTCTIHAGMTGTITVQ